MQIISHPLARQTLSRLFLLCSTFVFITIVPAAFIAAEPTSIPTPNPEKPWLPPIAGSYVDQPFAGVSCNDAVKHQGVDLVTRKTTGVVAPEAGLVIVAAEMDPFFSGLRNLIVIDHGNHTTTVYANLGEQLVHTGDWVRRGQRIAMTQTPNPKTKLSSTHVELHFQGKPIDPFKRLPYVFFDLQLPAPSWQRKNAPE